VLKLSVLSEMIVTEQNATRRAELLNALEESLNLKLKVVKLKVEVAELKLKAEVAELKVQTSQIREMMLRTEMLDAEGALNMRGYLGKYVPTSSYQIYQCEYGYGGLIRGGTGYMYS
jgi:hypothetical protein